MNTSPNNRSRGCVALITIISGCMLATSAAAAPFPGFGGPGHPGFGPRGPGHSWHPADALVLLGASVATLAILHDLDVQQRRLNETAQVQALSANVGERIVWEDGKGAAGSITTVRRGMDSAGRQCREFRQVVTIGNRTESAYGTACRNSDGSWQIVR